MSVEDAGLLLETLSLHVGDLLVGHLHEGLAGCGIASSLGLGVLNLVRGVGQIRLNCDARDADADAIRGVYSTVHCYLLLMYSSSQTLTDTNRTPGTQRAGRG